MRKHLFLMLFVPAMFVTCRGNEPIAYAQPMPQVEPILKLSTKSLELGLFRLGRIQVTETNGKIVKWFSGSKDLDIIPLQDNGKSIIVQGLKPGIFYIFAYTAIDSMPSEPVEVQITIKGDLPTPPDPVVPPAPKDKFAADLKEAWNKEDGNTKREQLPKHVNFYKWSAKESRKAELNTVGDLNTAMRLEAKRQSIEGKLPKLSYVIGGYLQEKLPNEINTPISPVRSQCEMVLGTVAEYLEKLQ